MSQGAATDPNPFLHHPRRCYYSICRQFEITKMFWSGSRIVFLAGRDVMMSTSLAVVSCKESEEEVSEYQETYSTKKDISQTNRIRINLKRIPFASHVKDIWSDADGLNCIYIRVGGGSDFAYSTAGVTPPHSYV